ncbi:MAG: molybdopterin-dependent oxidoreductase, partial [Pseudomonadota bacterium]
FQDVLKSGKNTAILLGNFAQQHPQAAAIHAAAQALAQATGAKLGFLGEAANSVGGYVAGLPAAGGLPQALKKNALLLLNIDPALDCAHPLGDKASIVNLSAFKSDVGDVLLPIAPFSETSGTFVSTEGRVQSFHGAVQPLGEARPAWKVLRVLGTLLDLPGFEFDSSEEVKAECLRGKDLKALLSNGISDPGKPAPVHSQGIQRIADVPIYFADPLARRSAPLQQTRDAQPPRAWMNRKLFEQLGLASGSTVKITQGKGEAMLAAALDDKLPDNCVRVAAGHPLTAGLGPMFGSLAVEKITVQRAA